MQSAKECRDTYADNNLPFTGQLHELASFLAACSVAFHINCHAHFYHEIDKVGKMNMSNNVTLMLVLEQFKIIYNSIHDARKHAFKFSLVRPQVDHLVRYLIVTLKAHMVMDCFGVNKFKYDPSLLADFICFFTNKLLIP